MKRHDSLSGRREKMWHELATRKRIHERNQKPQTQTNEWSRATCNSFRPRSRPRLAYLARRAPIAVTNCFTESILLINLKRCGLPPRTSLALYRLRALRNDSAVELTINSTANESQQSLWQRDNLELSFDARRSYDCSARLDSTPRDPRLEFCVYMNTARDRT